MVYGHKTEYRLRMRAGGAACGAWTIQRAPRPRDAAASRHGPTWRGRFAEHGLSELSDRERTGRPPVFTAPQVAETKALACQLPAETGLDGELPVHQASAGVVHRVDQSEQIITVSMRPYSANAAPGGMGWPSRPNVHSRS